MPLSVLGCLHSPSVDQIHQFSPVLTTVQPAPANCLKSSTLFLRPLWYDNHSSRKSPRSAILLLERLIFQKAKTKGHSAGWHSMPRPVAGMENKAAASFMYWRANHEYRPTECEKASPATYVTV